jgi:hypothetical protein
MLIRDVHFSDYAFKSRSRHLVTSFQSLAQEATHADPTVESRGSTALLAFCRAFGHTRGRVRKPVRGFHHSYPFNELPCGISARRRSLAWIRLLIFAEFLKARIAA